MTRRRAECHFTRSAVLGLLAFAILGGTLSAAPDLELAIGARNALGKPPAVRLTRKIPPLVRQTCKQLATDTPLRVVCPPLVPRSRIVPISGLYGFWSATHATKGPLSRFYEMSFNAGNPFGTIHWIVAEGTPGSVRHWVLSDRQNEVKGRPRRIGRLYMHGLEAVIYRFPDYPAGGLFGGHLAALVQADGLVFVASIHGYQDARASAEMAVAMAHAR